jgi:ketosteroid isomerase-like protein
MTTDDNKRLVRRALEEIYANGDLELADELVHPDFVDHAPAHELPAGPESVKQIVRSLHETFGDLRFEVEDEIAEGDRVVQVAPDGAADGPRGDRADVRRQARLHLADRRRADRGALGKPRRPRPPQAARPARRVIRGEV